MRFSDRIPAQLQPTRLAALLRRKRERGRELIDLSESNPTRVGLAYPVEDILQALGDPVTLSYSPMPQGLPQTRRAVSDYYARRGARVDPDEIFLTTSTSEAYSLLFKLLLDPGQQLLAPCPGYPLIDCLATAEGVEAGAWTFYFDGEWQPDLAGLEENITSRTRLLVLVHPNNPTGAYLKASQWESLREVCRRRQLAVICDEVFWDYRLKFGDPIFDPLAEEQVPLFVLNGLSKAAGLPQMKLGWIVLRGPYSLRKQAAERLEFLADHYLSVSTPIQCAAGGLLQAGAAVREQIRQRIKFNLEVLNRTLEKTAARALPVEGGWYAVIELPRIHSSQDWALALLDQDGVVVHPGSFYGFSDGCHLIVSLLPQPNKFREGVRRLAVRASET